MLLRKRILTAVTVLAAAAFGILFSACLQPGDGYYAQKPVVITIANIWGVDIPVTGVIPVTSIYENEQFRGTVAWSGNPYYFDASTEYIATITLTAKAGYTLKGVPANFFTVSGAIKISNNADSGVIYAWFPATAGFEPPPPEPPEPPDPPDTPIPPNAEVITLTENIWAEGSIMTSNEQWFKFTATADTQYIHFKPGTMGGVTVELYDSALKSIGYLAYLHSNSLYTTKYITSGEEYFIKVMPMYSSYRGTYRIVFSPMATAPSLFTIDPIPDQAYTGGSAITPDVTVRAGAVTLTQGVDYTVMYSNNTNAGIATVTITGKGSYADNIGSATFKILATFSNRFEYYWVGFGSDDLLTTSGGATSIAPGESLTITARDPGYTGHQWYLNGVNTGITTDNYTFFGTTFGSHTINLFVEKDGILYSTSIVITVPPVLVQNTWAYGDAPLDGQQWYRFTATASSHYIYIYYGTLTNLYVQLYDSNLNSIGTKRNVSARSDRSFNQVFTSGQVYYIQVTPEASYSGTYQIAFGTRSQLPANATLTLNTWANGDISASNGEQWFMFTATSNSPNIHFSFGTLTSLYVQIYDSNYYAKGSSYNMTGSTKTLYGNSSYTSGQVYYIRVTPYSTSYSGTFRVAFNISASAPY